MNIAYSCNEKYISQTGISILSLLDNNRDIEDITVYLIGIDISELSKRQLIDITRRYSRQFVYIPFESICSNLNISSTGRHIASVYAKLFFHRIDNAMEKIFYLDSDTIVTSSLLELWNLNIDDYVFAEVETYIAKSREKLGLSDDDLFFNDGVALINLKKYRELDIEQKCLDFIAKYNGNPPVLSEGTINAVCKGLIYSLHPKYNLKSGTLFFSHRIIENIYNRPYYSADIINEAIRNPIVIHYLSSFYNRPWHKKCTHPFKDKYLYYKSVSYWKDIPLLKSNMSVRLKLIKILYRLLPGNFFIYLKKILGR